MRFWLILLPLAAIGIFFWRLSGREVARQPAVVIASVRIPVTVADSEAERQQGLSGRESLPENQGMLFVFDRSGRHGFWMKDMKFDLDFIWLKNNQVAELSEYVPAPEAGEQPVSLRPQAEVDRVIEVNAGFVKLYGLKVGDKAVYEFVSD